MRSIAIVCALGVLAVSRLASAGEGKSKSDEKIPVTASSEEARELYLKGRDLQEKLRATDARKLFQEAWAKDKKLALAAVGLANTSATANEFWESLHHATALAGDVSPGERLQIQALEAGAKGDAAAQKAALVKLAKSYPRDERAQNALGIWHFGQQDWPAAIAAFKKAVAINPEFSQPYNQMGYAYRFTDNFTEAEKAFKKYVELIPNDPNPYDSYAELLMKMGRFDESIAQYEKALKIDPNFIASLIGIGNDQIFLGRGDAARAAFARLASVARNVGEKRTANFWMSQSYVFEGQTDKALAEMRKNLAIAEEGKDPATASGDHAVMAEILLAAGRAAEAGKEFQAQVDNINKADVPPEVKETVARIWHYDAGRVALASGDVAAAKDHLAKLTKLVSVKKNRFELYAQHELAGQIALAEKKPAVAVAEFGKANPQDPRVLYQLGIALREKGDARKSKAMLTRAAEWNALANNYAFVRKLAQDALARG